MVDKDLASGRIRTATPHYKAVNEVPIDGMPVVIKGCFNCGGSHMIRDCTFSRDQVCIRLNRYLHDRYNAKGANGKGGRAKRGAQFGNQRYYQSAALTKSASDPTPTNTNATDSAVQCTNGSFDDYLKLIQKGTEQDKEQDKQDTQKTATSEFIETDVSTAEDGQVSESNECDDQMGLKLAPEIEGLKILRTKKEIEDALAAHKLELEADAKKKKDEIMAKINRGNGRTDRAQTNESNWRGHRRGETLQSAHSQSQSQSHPGDVDHRPNRRERRKHLQRERDDYDEHDRRDRDRDRERERNGDRDRDRRSRREERGRGRGARSRSRSRSGGRGRGGYRDRERDRDRRGGRQCREDSDEEIDYGFKKKKNRIIKYINDRYKSEKSEERDRHRDRDRHHDRRRTHRRFC